jgi:ABC-type transport system involved in cytochrome c biogenesis permease subunit
VDHGVNLFWFAASYALALGLELWHQFRPRPVLRYAAVGFGAAGLLAHTLYLATVRPALAGQFGWMLFLSWILAVFYLYGTLHHGRIAWAVFVLPLVLGLVGLAKLFEPATAGTRGAEASLWATLHGVVLLLATVGMCVGFLASLMYLVQARRLRAKMLPGHGMKLLSLERLEAMHRRAINLAFPLLTAGLLIGAVLMFRNFDRLSGWRDPRVLSAAVLWLAFAVMLVVRYGYHLRGRPVALLTIAAFVLMLCCLALSHPTMEQAKAPPPDSAGGDS